MFLSSLTKFFALCLEQGQIITVVKACGGGVSVGTDDPTQKRNIRNSYDDH